MAGRRGHGEGSIFADKERGGFVVLVRHDGGRRKARAKTITEARAKLKAIQAEIDATGGPGDGNLTVHELADQWSSKVLGARDHSPATIESYRWALQVIDSTLGTRRVRSLTPEAVEKELAKLAVSGWGVKPRPMARASLVKVRSVLGQVLAFGERRGAVVRNVARVSELPAAARRSPDGRALTVDQARQLLEVTDADRLAAMWATMLMLGLRPGEVSGLLWDDVDHQRARLHVRRSLKHRGPDGPVIDEALKTSRSRRTLDIPPPLLERLARHRRNQAAERLKAGPLWSTDWPQLVFTSTAGTPLNPSNTRRSFATLTIAAGLGRWHPHELRHSAASILSAAGVPLERIADVLGHDGTRMTALVYRHAVAPSIDAATDVMTGLFQ
ncbi:MAG: tyrosine recombinase XerC [Acidimicrobiia bacterium]